MCGSCTAPNTCSSSTGDAVAEMKRLIPHAATVDVGAAGHMVAGDDNDVFTASLEQFLAAVESHRPAR